jgi:hypothetical protein
MNQGPMIAPTDALPIALIGLDFRQRNAIELVFRSRCKDAYRIVDDDSAQAWIVDLDDYHSSSLIRARLGKHDACPCLFLSTTEGATAGGRDQLSLKKPFRLDDFLWMLEQLEKRARPAQSRIVTPVRSIAPVAASRQPTQPYLAAAEPETRSAALRLAEVTQHPYIGSAPDIDLDDPSQHAAIFYDPAHFLQGHMQRAWRHALDRKTRIRLTGPWREIHIDPESGLTHCHFEPQQLRSYASLPLTSGSIATAPADAGPPPDSHRIDASRLIWKLALWASRGRLPQGTPLDTPIYVRHWPNLTRLDIPPSALAITALWARKPHSLRDTARLLGIPQRFLFAYYSAAHAAQLAAPTNRAVDMLFAPEPLPAPPQRGLLQRILDRLRG